MCVACIVLYVFVVHTGVSLYAHLLQCVSQSTATLRSLTWCGRTSTARNNRHVIDALQRTHNLCGFRFHRSTKQQADCHIYWKNATCPCHGEFSRRLRFSSVSCCCCTSCEDLHTTNTHSTFEGKCGRLDDLEGSLYKPTSAKKTIFIRDQISRFRLSVSDERKYRTNACYLNTVNLPWLARILRWCEYM